MVLHYSATMSAPPPYTTATTRKTTTTSFDDSQLWALRGYDIVYVVDDLSLMAWTEAKSGIIPWPHARDALAFFSGVCEEWDEDGQDVWFLNRAEPLLNALPQQITQAFDAKPPAGGTNMGRALLKLASKYFYDFNPATTKPVNVIAITDGAFTDDVTSVIKWIVQQLDKEQAMPNQFGVQFVQIGADPDARKALEALDDDLTKAGLTRDIVDTVPWQPKKLDGPQFDGRYLVKVVCGAINKRLDDDNLGAHRGSTVKARRPSKLKRLFGRS